GYVPGRSIMVMLQSAAEPATRQLLRMGDPCVVRFESGDNLYAFDTQVLCLAEQPFVHAHLAYPQGVQGTMVRRSQRVPVNDVVVMMLVMEEAGRKLSVALADISLSGARLVAGSRLGEIGERFSIEIPHIGTAGAERVALPCVVRYVREEQSVSAGGKRVYHHGVEFTELSRQALVFIERYIGDRVVEQRGIGA
ncbi:MAG: PilZ domain-containing protein, partial [Gammaproteobacteria bacterium]|nr:PilZ domain-containing protein [Gammaproteobacteria bacterium]